MPNEGKLELEILDPILTGVIKENRDKVLGWLRDQPGCWGFLAGQGVTITRQQLGRSLSDTERRLVWSRLWWWLERLKSQALDQ